jgi:urocanate hydratase
MPPEFTPPFGFALQVERLYAALLHTAPPSRSSEPGLGGKLLYAGELDEAGLALVAAGNIAGAASLASTADPAAQKPPIRTGVVDFLVTSLDEALRILKNEIRKREPVAVCVAAAPESVEREMLERGVLPDLLAPSTLPGCTAFLSQGACPVESSEVEESYVLLAWSVAAAPALWLPKLDALAHDCLQPEDWPAHRWLRLAPRYLGRQAQGVRVLHCDEPAAAEFLKRVRVALVQGEISVPVEIRWSQGSKSELHRL